MNKLPPLIIDQLIKRKIRFSDKIKKCFRVITTKISGQTLHVLRSSNTANQAVKKRRTKTGSNNNRFTIHLTNRVKYPTTKFKQMINIVPIRKIVFLCSRHRRNHLSERKILRSIHSYNLSDKTRID